MARPGAYLAGVRNCCTLLASTSTCLLYTSGIVVLLIGLTLIKVGLISMGGGFGAMASGTFASAENLTLSGLVLGTIILLNRVPVVWIRSTALVLALAVGYIAAAYMGRLDFTGAREAALFQVRCV